MKIHLIKEKTIIKYCERQARARPAFSNWLEEIRDARWNRPGDIARTFRTADILGNGTSRVVFDIGGNKYRMICMYRFLQVKIRLYVCWIGTHAEYDQLCSRNEQYNIWKY